MDNVPEVNDPLKTVRPSLDCIVIVPPEQNHSHKYVPKAVLVTGQLMESVPVGLVTLAAVTLMLDPRVKLPPLSA